MNTVPDPAGPQKGSAEATGAVHLCLLLGRILFAFGATTRRIQAEGAVRETCNFCKIHGLTLPALPLQCGGGTRPTTGRSRNGV